MSDLLDFLLYQKKVWISVLVIFFALLSLVAWWIGSTPESPFAYRFD